MNYNVVSLKDAFEFIVSLKTGCFKMNRIVLGIRNL